MLGVDIGSSSIKVVELRKKKGKAVLVTYGELALGPYSELEIGRATNLPSEKLAVAVVDLLREANASTKNCGVAIPVGSSLITLIDFPPVSEKELPTMVPIEAKKYIPVPISEVALNWRVVPKETSELYTDEAHKDRMQVLVVAIHNEVLSRYQDIIKKSGLESTFIEIEIFSTIRAVLDQGTGTVMIFDLGASSTKLYIVERGVVHSSHTVNRGSQDVTSALSTSLGVTIAEAEAIKRSFGSAKRENEKQVFETISLSMEYIFYEANRVLLDYERKYNKNVSKVIMTGGGVGYTGLIELAKMNIQTEVVLGNPFAKVEFPAFLDDILRHTGPEFSVAVGVALRKLQELE